MGSEFPGVGPHNDFRINDSSIMPRGVYGSLCNQQRGNHSGVDRQPSGIESRHCDVFKVPATHGRVAQVASFSDRARGETANGVSAVGSQPFCRPTVAKTALQRLPPKNSLGAGALVDRGKRTRFQDVLDRSHTSPTPARVSATSPPQNRGGQFQRFTVGTTLAETALAAGANLSVRREQTHTRQSRVISEEVGSNAVVFRGQRPQGDGATVLTDQIAARLRATAPAGGGLSSRLEEGADLIVAGYSDSRLTSQSSSMKRFIEFCDSEGVAWDSASRHAMVAFLADLYATTKISGETATQYVSAINTAYLTMGLDPPGRASNAERLYFDVKKSLEGFKRLRTRLSPARGQPTPATTLNLIYALCVVVSKALDHKNLTLVRDGLANIFQYYMISRPTMTAMMKWDQVEFISAKKIRVTIPRLAAGRKNKNMPSKLVERKNRHYFRNTVSPYHFATPISRSC